MMSTPIFSSGSSISTASSAGAASMKATPPPATMPSSTAARVACRASSMRCLISLSSDLGSSADLDDGNAAGELGQALLELLTVEVGGGVLHLALNLRDAASMASLEPAPPTTTVLSLETVTDLAVPSISAVMSATFTPNSSRAAWPPVRTAMSSRMRLRRSP